MVTMFRFTDTKRIEDIEVIRFNDSSVWLSSNGAEREAPRFSDKFKYFPTRQAAVDFAVKDMERDIMASRERIKRIREMERQKAAKRRL